jgi:hypothetical protein
MMARPKSDHRTDRRALGLKPELLVGDIAYGAAPMLNWLVEEKSIAPHIPVFDKSKRDDGTFSRSDFRYDPTNDVYHCPDGKRLGTSGTIHEGKTLLYRASRLDCDICRGATGDAEQRHTRRTTTQRQRALERFQHMQELPPVPQINQGRMRLGNLWVRVSSAAVSCTQFSELRAMRHDLSRRSRPFSTQGRRASRVRPLFAHGLSFR